MRTAIRTAGLGATDHETAVAPLGEGWTGEEALAIAANLTGDPASTASIAGQI